MGTRGFSIGQRLAAGFSIAFALIVLQLGASFWGLSKVEALQSDKEVEIGRRERSACALKDAILNHSILGSRYLIEPSEDRREAFRNADVVVREMLDQMMHVNRGAEGREILVQRIVPLAREYQTLSDTIYRLAEDATRPPVSAIEQEIVTVRSTLLEHTRRYHDIQHQAVSRARFTIHTTLAALKRGLVAISILIVVVFIVSAVITTRAVHAPVRRLVDATRTLAAGDYGGAIDAVPAEAARSRDEIGLLGEAFKQMAVSLRARDAWLAADAKLSTVLASSLDERDLAGAALEQMIAFAGGCCGAIYRVNPERGELDPVATRGMTGPIKTFAIDEGVLGQAIATRDVVVLNGLEGERAESLQFAAEHAVARALCLVPAICQDRAAGVVLLGSTAELSDEQIAFIEHGSRQLFISWENAVTHDRVKRLATDLHQKAADLEETGRRKNEFLATLAHEIRNPLAAISNASHVLSHRACCGDDRASIRPRQIIERQIRNLSRLLDDLLNISRLDSDELVLQELEVDLVEVVEHVIEILRPAAEDRGLRFGVSVEQAPLMVRADPVRLEQILGNLLNNATKFTEPGGTVDLSVGRERDEIVIRVRDTGKGISKELLPEIFKPFVQEAPKAGTRETSIGVGLTLVQKLVRIFGGSVTASSDGPGSGSEFIVRLPALPGERSRSHADQVEPLQLTGDPLTVLVVDDNHDVAGMLKEMIESLGHTARVAYDGPSAIAAAEALVPDLALIDIALPGMDGYQVAHQLREIVVRSGSCTRLVALTGFSFDRRISEAGFHRHFVKPISLVELKQLLFERPAAVDSPP